MEYCTPPQLHYVHRNNSLSWMRLTLRPLAVNVQLVVGSAGSTVRGLLPAAHLSDHPAGAAALGARLAVGSQLGELVVLELQPGRGTALVSRKASLRGAATSLPSALEDLAEGAIHPGYVASVTADAVYVRFLARLTGEPPPPPFPSPWGRRGPTAKNYLFEGCTHKVQQNWPWRCERKPAVANQ